MRRPAVFKLIYRVLRCISLYALVYFVGRHAPEILSRPLAFLRAHILEALAQFAASFGRQLLKSFARLAQLLFFFRGELLEALKATLRLPALFRRHIPQLLQTFSCALLLLRFEVLQALGAL